MQDTHPAAHGVPARGCADRPDGSPTAVQTETQVVTKQSICIFPEFSKQQIARGQPLARKLILGTMLFLPLSASLTSLPPAPGDTNITKSGSGFACLWERLGAGALRLPGWGQRRWSLFTPTPFAAQLVTCRVTQEPLVGKRHQLTWAGLSQAQGTLSLQQ